MNTHTRHRRLNRIMHYKIALLLPLGLSLSACAPAKTLSTPANWPTEWASRSLYNTPNALIYASSDGIAGEVDRIAERIASEYASRAKSTGSKGLVIATGMYDKSVIHDYKTYYMLNARATAHAEPMPSETEVAAQWQNIEEAMETQGVDLDLELRMSAVAIPKSDITGMLGLPAQVAADVDWVVAIPTTGVIHETCRDSLLKKLEKDGIGPLAQFPLRPFLVFEERKMVAKAETNRDVTIFSQLAAGHDGWTADTQRLETNTYMQQKIDQRMFPILTLLGGILEQTAEAIGGTVEVIGETLGAQEEPLP